MDSTEDKASGIVYWCHCLPCWCCHFHCLSVRQHQLFQDQGLHIQLFHHNYYSCQGLQMKVVLKVGIIPWDGSPLYSLQFYRVCSSSQDVGSSMSPTSHQGHTTGFHCYGRGSLRSQESVCVCCILCGSWRMTSSRQDSFSLMFQHEQFFFSAKTYMTNFQLRYHSPLHGVVILF